MRKIPLTQGQQAWLDDADFEKFGSVRWYAMYCRSIDGFYAKRDVVIPGGKRLCLYLHREIMDRPKGKKVDHKNHNTLDCRKQNLRICDDSQNMMNRKGAASHSKSGIRGVHWHKRAGKWTSQIRSRGIVYYLGLFTSKKDAARVYLDARKKYFGEFAGGS